MNLRWTGALLGICFLAITPVMSHPMGNFSISHYSRFTIGPQSVDLLYVIDMAEIPSFQEKPLVDLNGNGTLEAREQDAYLAQKIEGLTGGLVVRLNGTRRPLERISQQLELLPGGLNLPTMKISLSYQLKTELFQDANLLEYEDTNFPGRAGWKEIVVVGDGIEESSAGSIDKSQQLTHYPEDPAIKPPEDLVARVRFKPPAARVGSPSGQANSATPGLWSQRTTLLLGAVLLSLIAIGGFLVWRWFSKKRGM